MGRGKNDLNFNDRLQNARNMLHEKYFYDIFMVLVLSFWSLTGPVLIHLWLLEWATRIFMFHSWFCVPQKKFRQIWNKLFSFIC